MRLAGRVEDFVLSPNIAFSHTTQSAGCLVIVWAKRVFVAPSS